MDAEDKLLDYVIRHTDNRFDEVNERCSSIEEKVDQLLQFKWQVISGSVVLSAIASLALQLFLYLAGK